MKILINCYACSPYRGSEPGMGWHFVKALAHYHELHIITESKWKKDLDKYFSENPTEKQLFHFYFIRKNRHKRLRKIWPPSYYWFYREWQRKTLQLAKELDAREHFDIVHQLNMVGYREPGYLYRLGKPYVWGPVGGFNNVPWCMLPSMGIKGMLYYFMRNLINLQEMHLSNNVHKAVKRSDAIISATQDSYNAFIRLWNRDSILIPEVGLEKSVEPLLPSRESKMRICWSGQHTPRKSLNLLLESLAVCSSREQVELHVLGKGECTDKWKRMVEKLELHNITWYGWVSREKSIDIMRNSHLFIITSLADATSTVLLEALSMGLPVIALNHLGFANVITDKCGVKINIHSHKQVVRDIAKAIEALEQDELHRMELAHGAVERAKEFSWEDKAAQINEIYRKVTGK